MTQRIEPSALETLIQVLRRRGYRVIGPALREGAIAFDEIQSASELPAGWTDRQEAGTYRLQSRGDSALFGYAVGPHSWKKFLHPAVRRLWKAEREQDGFRVEAEVEDPAPYAFLGVRACDLAAIQVQDKVFLNSPHTDPSYKEKRERAFIVAVNCSVAGGTCFCVSMGTGPRVTKGYDLALTEILEKESHYLIMEAGSERGAEVLRELPSRPASGEEEDRGRRVVETTAENMGRVLDNAGVKSLLYRNYENPRWDEVASRCLSCANCTMVCPTCFCSTVEDVTDLTGDHTERWQKWDSCFTMDFSYVNGGGSVRSTVRSRYRQWMTHKLATWWDQFGTSGCVGCGRCITWCPVGIDITEEAAAIKKSETET